MEGGLIQILQCIMWGKAYTDEEDTAVPIIIKRCPTEKLEDIKEKYT